MKLDKKNLFSLVLKETYYFLRFLLNNVKNSERMVASANEKNVLKNIGSWLGSITLARNKPIVMKYLNIKSLIADGYHA
jgi:CCR4-NOT transcription complex subunit 1